MNNINRAPSTYVVVTSRLRVRALRGPPPKIVFFYVGQQTPSLGVLMSLSLARNDNNLRTHINNVEDREECIQVTHEVKGGGVEFCWVSASRVRTSYIWNR